MRLLFTLLYLSAHVLWMTGTIKAVIYNHQLKKRLPGSMADGMLHGFQDLDKILKAALPWWLGAFVAALFAGFVGHFS